jgi:hypothetical protein
MSGKDVKVGSWQLTLAAGAIVGAFAWLGSVSGVPTTISPAPLLMVLFHIRSEHIWSRWPRLAVDLIPALVAPLAFFVWFPGLFAGALRVPRRSLAGFGTFVLADVLHFALGLAYGVEYQGMTYTAALILLNAILVCAAGVLLVRARRTPSFRTNLAFHLVSAVWLSWCAMPWLGELP